MKKHWRSAACLLLCGLLVWFLADAEAVRAATAEALSLCARSVIPSMFPFLVLCGLLVSLGLGEWLSPRFAGLMGPLFRLPGLSSSALLLGLVGGYPIGARTAAELCRQNLLTQAEAERLLTFCNNANPVFFISVLGSGVFGSVRTGVWLWLIHILAALLTGMLFRGSGRHAGRQAPSSTFPCRSTSLPSALTGAVSSAVTGMLSICAFVLLFYVLARPLATLGGRAAPVLVGLLELFSLIPLLTADRFGFVAAAAMSGWGGLSVLCQTAAVLEGSGLSAAPCAKGKAVQGLLSGLLALLLSPCLFP